jgi:hypothetical protein
MDKAPMTALFKFLVVVPCICALALHFVAESAGRVNISASIELNADGEGLQDQREHCEDDFAPTMASNSYQDSILFYTIQQLTVFCILPVFPPHLPPPKIQTSE